MSAPAPTNSAYASEYGQRLAAIKARYPFSRWATRGLPQYTAKACASFAVVFDRLISHLAVLGESATEAQKLECFHRAVVALNDLNRKDLTLIETEEREALCELCNLVAIAAGLYPPSMPNLMLFESLMASCSL